MRSRKMNLISAGFLCAIGVLSVLVFTGCEKNSSPIVLKMVFCPAEDGGNGCVELILREDNSLSRTYGYSPYSIIMENSNNIKKNKFITKETYHDVIQLSDDEVRDLLDKADQLYNATESLPEVGFNSPPQAAILYKGKIYCAHYYPGGFSQYIKDSIPEAENFVLFDKLMNALIEYSPVDLYELRFTY